jgi:hypothetical protein
LSKEKKSTEKKVIDETEADRYEREKLEKQFLELQSQLQNVMRMRSPLQIDAEEDKGKNR